MKKIYKWLKKKLKCLNEGTIIVIRKFITAEATSSVEGAERLAALDIDDVPTIMFFDGDRRIGTEIGNLPDAAYLKYFYGS